MADRDRDREDRCEPTCPDYRASVSTETLTAELVGILGNIDGETGDPVDIAAALREGADYLAAVADIFDPEGVSR